MSIPYQKDFYDRKRYFQGKDNPGDYHPPPTVKSPMPLSQLIIGTLFFAFIAGLFWLQIRPSAEHSSPEPVPAAAPPAATPPAPAKK